MTTETRSSGALIERAATGELLGPPLSVDAPPAEAVARELGVSVAAVELVRSSEVVDLHLDTFIWTRVFGYDFGRRHGNGPFDARWMHQTDVPRICDANLTGAVWSITTNPFRPTRNRAVTFHKNLARLRRLLRDDPRTEHVRTLSEFAAARAQGRHAALVGIQGGNALDSDPELVRSIPDDSIAKITVVHLRSSTLGRTSTPEPWRTGASTRLTEKGREFIAACDDARILVDLAHIHPDSFWDAVDVHDPSLPFIVSHTGVDGVTLHWRNLDDDQLIAVARSGGTVGIMFECGFVGADRRGEDAVDKVFAHFAHAVDVIGDEHVSIGSDWDGAIVTPRDFKTVTELPVLVQRMLDAGWSDVRIRRILGGNALRVLGALRP